ncbi:MAG: deaminase [Candidatus Aquilonibacter sp.]
MIGSDDERLLREAIELSRNAPPSQQAFSVGSVIARRDGSILTTGYSRERGGHSHAEHIAIEKAAALKLDLHDATLYTSLEPCSVRKSGLRACVTRIVEAGIRRVVFAMREPPVFVEGHGADVLADAGIEVVELDADAPLVAQINAHLHP